MQFFVLKVDEGERFNFKLQYYFSASFVGYSESSHKSDSDCGNNVTNWTPPLDNIFRCDHYKSTAI